MADEQTPEPPKTQSVPDIREDDSEDDEDVQADVQSSIANVIALARAHGGLPPPPTVEQRFSFATGPIELPFHNMLKDSKSSFLFAHKDNPIAWQEFSPSTVELAKRLDRKIFLAIGDSSCWGCHLLERYSFHDPQTAEIINTLFVPVLIDLNERPDVTAYCMAFSSHTRSGESTPLGIILWPTLEPALSHTFKKDDSHVHEQGLADWLLDVRDMFANLPERCWEASTQTLGWMRETVPGYVGIVFLPHLPTPKLPPSLAEIMAAEPGWKTLKHLRRRHDTEYGGFVFIRRAYLVPKHNTPALSLEPLARVARYGLAPAAEEGEAVKDNEESSAAEEADYYSDSDSDPDSDLGPDMGFNRGFGDRKLTTEAEALDLAMGEIRSIWKGGVHDWIGGGVFGHYSYDRPRNRPQFDKTLFLQAQLVSSCLDFALLAKPSAQTSPVVEASTDGLDSKICFDLAASTLTFILRDLKSPEGGFYSGFVPHIERDGQLKEGGSYLWTKAEFDDVLGADAELVGYFFGVTQKGNIDSRFDPDHAMGGMNLPYQDHSITQVAEKFALPETQVQRIVDESIDRLLQRRESRGNAGLDDMIVSGWNGLVLTCLAKALTSLPASYGLCESMLSAAAESVKFVRSSMYDPGTRCLARTYRQGKGADGQLDDYGCLIQGLLDLYQALLSLPSLLDDPSPTAAPSSTDSGIDAESVLSFALELQEAQVSLFWDNHYPGFFAYLDNETTGLSLRLKDARDTASVSGTSVSALNLARWSVLASDQYAKWKQQAEDVYRGAGATEKDRPTLVSRPHTMGLSVAGLMDLQAGWKAIIITGGSDDPVARALVELVYSMYIPNKVVIRIDSSHPPTRLCQLNATVQSLLEDTRAALRVWADGSCSAPVTNMEEAQQVLQMW